MTRGHLKLVAPCDAATSDEVDIKDAAFVHWCTACEHHHSGEQLGFICVGCTCEKRPGATVRGGPARCPRHCSECPEERCSHHFIDSCGDAEEEPEHEAAQAGHPVWFVCKHCDAWTLDLGEDG
jgi:hypothetical protein